MDPIAPADEELQQLEADELLGSVKGERAGHLAVHIAIGLGAVPKSEAEDWQALESGPAEDFDVDELCTIDLERRTVDHRPSCTCIRPAALGSGTAFEA